MNIKFRIIGTINYKNNDYLFLDSDVKIKYFLKYVDGKLVYPTIEEYAELLDLINYPKPFEIIDADYVNFEPKVMKFDEKLKKLIAVSLVSGMLFFNSAGAEATMLTDQDSNNGAKIGYDTSVLDEMDLSYDLIADKYVNMNDYFGNSLYHSPTDFSTRYYNGEVKRAEDCITLIKVRMDGGNFPIEVGNSLIKGLNNLMDQMPGLDFSILYHNLENMEVLFLPTDEFNARLKEDYGYDVKDVKGTFYYLSDKAYFNSDCYDEDLAFHEILGHANTHLYDKYENMYALPSIVDSTIRKDEVKYSNYGGGIEEARASLVECLASGKMDKLFSNENPYVSFNILLDMMMRTGDMDLETFLNEGLPYYMERLDAIGIHNPLYYISSMDDLLAVIITDGRVARGADFDNILYNYLVECSNLSREYRDTVNETLVSYPVEKFKLGNTTLNMNNVLKKYNKEFGTIVSFVK